jgi:hypothetical protein
MLPRTPAIVNPYDPACSVGTPETPVVTTGLPRLSAVASGAALEADLNRFHATLSGWYVQRNYADRERGKKGAPDFIGLPTPPGRAVLFDAKSTRQPRWPISLLAPHQATAFERLTSVGHTAGVYLRLGSGPNMGDWWLPWGELCEGWRAYWQDRVTYYPTPRVRVTGMDWTRVCQ